MSTADYAARYAQRGMAIIPLLPRSKRPAVSSWLAYQKRAPTRDELGLWFTNTDNGIAIVTGAVSGNLAVLDCDDAIAYQAFRDAPQTLTVRTGKGWHLYYRTDEHVRTSPFHLPGSDGTHHVKAEGSYVVAPPSVHESGAVYQFVIDREPTVLAASELRSLLAAAGATPGSGTTGGMGDIRGRSGWVAELLSSRVAEGDRHVAFTRLAGYLSNRLHMDETCAVLRLWLAANVDGYERLPEYLNTEAQVRQWYMER